MKVQLKLVRIGMNMEEATITKWHKQPGETFELGDVIYEIETEKVNQEVEAPAAGTMVEIRVPEGEIAEVDQTVCVIDAEPVGTS
jgi:pyruvate/2-oxoglutarate dehydrogenase complex dihydrolipoamide acyltransferase (E2) component